MHPENFLPPLNHGAFQARPSVSCLRAWETKTEAGKKPRRLPSRSRNRNPDASARSSRRLLRRNKTSQSLLLMAARRMHGGEVVCPLAPALRGMVRSPGGRREFHQCCTLVNAFRLSEKGHPHGDGLLTCRELKLRATAVKRRPMTACRAPVLSRRAPCAHYSRVPAPQACR